MDSSGAIAAVTETLRELLDRELNAAIPGTKVTLRPPDKARDSGGGNQVNLFLYLACRDAARQNARPESGKPSPVALSLHYLLSVYGRNDDDASPSSHLLLGRSIQVLHDHAVFDLGPAGRPLRAHVSLLPMCLDGMTKLWTVFQTPYRLSAAFEVLGILIESAHE